MKFSLVLSLVLATAADAIITTCHHNNVFRCLLGHAAQATPFCQSYLKVVVVTSVISTTTTVCVVTEQANAAAQYSNSTMTKLPRDVPAIPSLKIVDMNARRQAAIMTALAKLQPPTVTARAELFPREVPGPSCLTQVSHSSYPASRISSACSCLDIPDVTIHVIATAPPITITKRALPRPKGAQAPKAPVQLRNRNGVPDGPFKISIPKSKKLAGSFLSGILLDDFFTGFKLPYGEYDLHFTIDQATGYVTCQAPNKDGRLYLVVYTGLLKSGNTIPYVVTESSPEGKFWAPLLCRVGKDANGRYPLMCRAKEYTIPSLICVNGDGHKQLGIAPPGDRSGGEAVDLFAEFVGNDDLKMKK